MKKEKNRKMRTLVGAVVMVAMVFAAMPLGVAHSLEDLRDEAEGQFYNDRAGFSIWESLDKRREAANNLLTVARKYTEAHPELDPYVNNLEYQVQANEGSYDDTFYWEGQTNMEMGAAAEALAAELEKLPLDEKDKKYPAQLVAQMRSEQDKIQRSSYNDAAREFNGRLQVFPVNILRGFTDVKELVPFDEHGDAVSYVMEDEADTIREAVFEGTAEEQGRRAGDFADEVGTMVEEKAEAWAEGFEGQMEAWAGDLEETIEDAVERP